MSDVETRSTIEEYSILVNSNDLLAKKLQAVKSYSQKYCNCNRISLFFDSSICKFTHKVLSCSPLGFLRSLCNLRLGKWQRVVVIAFNELTKTLFSVLKCLRTSKSKLLLLYLYFLLFKRTIIKGFFFRGLFYND